MKYDIFLSYRRKTGKNYARTLKPELEKRGYSVFLDFDELKDGVFDDRIRTAITDAPVFMLILSEGALDRCVNEGDWVREEILYANEKKRHIVPVEVDKSFREFPENLPEDVKSVLGAHQFSQIDTESLFEVSFDKLVKERISPYTSPRKMDNKRDSNLDVEIHVDTDADCEVYRFGKKIAELKAYQDNIISLIPGDHKLTFVSTEMPEIKDTKVYNVPSEKYSGIIEVELANKIHQKKKLIEIEEELERKRKAEIAENERLQREALRLAEEEKPRELTRKRNEERIRSLEERRLEEERKNERSKRLAEERKSENDLTYLVGIISLFGIIPLSVIGLIVFWLLYGSESGLMVCTGILSLFIPTVIFDNPFNKKGFIIQCVILYTLFVSACFIGFYINSLYSVLLGFTIFVLVFLVIFCLKNIITRHLWSLHLICLLFLPICILYAIHVLYHNIENWPYLTIIAVIWGTSFVVALKKT